MSRTPLKFQERPPAPVKWEPDEHPRKNTPVLKLVPKERNKTLLIAIPTAKYIEPETFKSIYDLELPNHIIPTFQYFYGYNVEQIRNLIAHHGRRYDYLFCVDSDIVVPQDALIKMLAAERDVISGCYIQRILERETLELFTRKTTDGRVPISALVPPRLIEVDACGFGCVLIKGEVLQKMTYPHFVYKSALDHKDTIAEDIYFCTKAKGLGFTIWADTSIICPHIGTKTFLPTIPSKQ